MLTVRANYLRAPKTMSELKAIERLLGNRVENCRVDRPGRAGETQGRRKGIVRVAVQEAARSGSCPERRRAAERADSQASGLGPIAVR